MNEKLRNLVPSLVFPLLSFSGYWRSLDDAYSASNLLWGALVTIILAVSLYLFLEKKPERFSLAWAVGISVGFGLFIVGSTANIVDGVLNLHGKRGSRFGSF